MSEQPKDGGAKSRPRIVEKFQCECGGWLSRCVDTRPGTYRGLHVVRRSRRCGSCGNNHFTLEATEPDFISLAVTMRREKEAQMEELRRQLQELEASE